MLLGILAFAYSVSGTDMLTAYNNSVREELFDLICLYQKPFSITANMSHPGLSKAHLGEKKNLHEKMTVINK